MSHSPYFITLKPKGAFYFGSEQNFAGGENYFALSRQFPQQSTLLGVLRYKLLEANNMLARDHGRKLDKAAIDHIGPQSFIHESLELNHNFGAISHLSALSIFDGKNFFFPGHRDSGFKGNGKKEDHFQLDIKSSTPNLKGYDIKTWYPPFVIGEGGKPIELTSIFKSKTQVGIYRTTARYPSDRKIDEDEEKGFYKKTSWVFQNRDWAFCFFAWINRTAGDKLIEFTSGNGNLTPVGGEHSLFAMEVKEAEHLSQQWVDQAAKAHTMPSAFHRAILLSDTYANPEDLYKLSHFAMAQPTPFRFMATSVEETENYFAIENPGGKTFKYLKKSMLFQLIQAGSVFYIKDDKVDEFKKAMVPYKAYHQIGNNEFMIHHPDNSIYYEPYKAK